MLTPNSVACLECHGIALNVLTLHCNSLSARC
jgi:hypothetical protein